MMEPPGIQSAHFYKMTLAMARAPVRWLEARMMEREGNSAVLKNILIM
jgi:hypothetical protein